MQRAGPSHHKRFHKVQPVQHSATQCNTIPDIIHVFMHCNAVQHSASHRTRFHAVQHSATRTKRNTHTCGITPGEERVPVIVHVSTHRNTPQHTYLWYNTTRGAGPSHRKLLNTAQPTAKQCNIHTCGITPGEERVPVIVNVATQRKRVQHSATHLHVV